MEDLVYQCQGMSLKTTWFNNSAHNLYCADENVYTLDRITKGQFIGYIVGTKAYTWDVPPSRFCIWLNDYYVIDCRQTPRCITSMIRKNKSDEVSNCCMAFAYKNDTIEVYIIATRDIAVNAELVIIQDTFDDFL